MKYQKALLILAVTATLAGGVFFARRSGTDYTVYSNDFNVYYFASCEILEGRDPYQNVLTSSTPYLYPPLLAEMLLPLALLPLPLAAYIWFLLNVACLTTAILMCGMLASRTGSVAVGRPSDSEITRPALIGVIAAAIIGRFVLDNMTMGQVNLVVTALAVAHVYFFERKKSFASAFALALAAAIKLTPFVLILYHVARRRFRFAAACATLSGVLMLAGFAPFGAAIETFAVRTVGNRQGFDLAYSGNQSIRSLEARARDQSGQTAREPFSIVSLVASLMILGVALFASWRASDEASASAPFLCCSVLLSPLSWKGHYVILLLPLALAVREAFFVARGSPRGYVWCAWLLTVFAIFNLTSPKLVGSNTANLAESWSLITLCGLLVYATTLVLAMRGIGKLTHIC